MHASAGGGGARSVYGRCRAAGGGRDGGADEPDQSECARRVSPPRRDFAMLAARGMRSVVGGRCLAALRAYM